MRCSDELGGEPISHAPSADCQATDDVQPTDQLTSEELSSQTSPASSMNPSYQAEGTAGSGSSSSEIVGEGKKRLSDSGSIRKTSTTETGRTSPPSSSPLSRCSRNSSTNSPSHSSESILGVSDICKNSSQV